MSKIAIVSNAEEGVVIDISGCDSPAEAKQYLSSTLQVSSRFWDGLTVDVNLGALPLNADEVAQILAILREVGVEPSHMLSSDVSTVAALYKAAAGGKSKEAPEFDSTWQRQGTIKCVDFRIDDRRQPDCATDLPALLIEGQVAGESLSTGKTDSAAAGYSIACAASMHLSLASGSDNEKIGLRVNGGNSSTQENSSVRSAAAVVATRAGDQPERDLTKSISRSSERAAGVLYLRQTLRSGQAVSHKGDLVIIGDVNPGAEVRAEGDITIWGALRGVAHAGTAGNASAQIRALKFDPIQLRIAGAIARAPDRTKAGFVAPTGPETARIVDGKIRISSSDPD